MLLEAKLRIYLGHSDPAKAVKDEPTDLFRPLQRRALRFIPPTFSMLRFMDSLHALQPQGPVDSHRHGRREEPGFRLIIDVAWRSCTWKTARQSCSLHLDVLHRIVLQVTEDIQNLWFRECSKSARDTVASSSSRGLNTVKVSQDIPLCALQRSVPSGLQFSCRGFSSDGLASPAKSWTASHYINLAEACQHD